MYNFESDSSLIIYVSRRNPQTTPWSFIFEYITRSAPAKARPSGRATRAARAAPREQSHMCIHLMPNSHII